MKAFNLKKITLITILTCVLFLTTSCKLLGLSKEGNAESDEIVVWADDPNVNIPVLNRAASKFDAGKFHVKVYDTAAIGSKLNTVLSSEDTKNLPNIIRLEDPEAKKMITAFPNTFLPMSDTVDFNNFPKYKTTISTIDGKTYGMPFDSGVAGFFYRTDILKEAGYEPKDLENITWQEFEVIGKDIKEKTGKEVLALVSPVSEEVDLLLLLLQSAGAWYFDKDGKPDLVNNPKVREVFKTIKRLNSEGLLQGNSDWSSRGKSLNDGTVFGIIIGAWFTPTISSMKDQAGLWGVTTMPRLDIEGGTNYSNHGGSSFYALRSGNKEKDEMTLKFLADMFAQDSDFYQSITSENHLVTSYLPAQKGKAWEEPNEFFGGEKVYQYFSKAMAKVPAVDYGVYSKEIQDVLRTNMHLYYNGKISLDEFLKKVETDFNNQFIS